MKQQYKLNNKGALDLAEGITSIIFALLLFACLTLTYSDIAAPFGVTLDNSTIAINNTLAAQSQIENITRSNGADNSNTFFPSISTLFAIFNIMIVAPLTDVSQLIELMMFKIGQYGGSSLLTMLKTAMIVSITAGILWVILSALFRTPSWSNK